MGTVAPSELYPWLGGEEGTREGITKSKIEK